MELYENCTVCGGELEETGDSKYPFKCIYCGKKIKESDLMPKDAAQNTNSHANTSAPAASGELTGEQVFDKVIDSVATIKAYSATVGGTASGFLVSSKGFFLTNAHAVCQSDGKLFPNINVVVGDKTYKAYPIAVGEPLGTAKGKVADLCLLWAEGDFSGHYVNKFCNYSEVKNGQREYIIGNPFGEGICITSGVISDKQRPLRGMDHTFLMTDAATNAGNSGGPHYNAKAEIIGVHVAGRNASEGMNYAVPTPVAEAFISDVVKHEKLRNVDFGELNEYRTRTAQSATVVISGIKLLLDVVEYIISFFKRK